MEAAASVLCSLQLLVHWAAMPPPADPGANAITVGSALWKMHATATQANHTRGTIEEKTKAAPAPKLWARR
jgi:hypothetical protein